MLLYAGFVCYTKIVRRLYIAGAVLIAKNSGINGKDMAEIVCPDIFELRTVRGLFGDGDMVCTLRDGAKFETRNIPNLDDTLELTLPQCEAKVVQPYRQKGHVANP